MSTGRSSVTTSKPVSTPLTYLSLSTARSIPLYLSDYLSLYASVSLYRAVVACVRRAPCLTRRASRLLPSTSPVCAALGEGLASLGRAQYIYTRLYVTSLPAQTQSLLQEEQKIGSSKSAGRCAGLPEETHLVFRPSSSSLSVCRHICFFRLVPRVVCRYHQEITRAADPFLLVAVYKECERLEMDRLRAEVLKAFSAPVMNVQPLLSLAHAAEALDVPQLLRECIRILADCSFALFSGTHSLPPHTHQTDLCTSYINLLL